MQIWRNQRGVSLIEVLAAALLLGIAVVLFMQLSDYNIMAIGKSDKSTQALRIADNALNTIRHDIEKATPEATWPLSTNPFSCNQTTSLPACQQLPPNFELTISHQAYSANSPTQLSASLEQKQISMPAIVHYNGIPTLITVTVKWG